MENKGTISLALVQQFVGMCHGDLNTVKALMQQQPALVNAVWDWGAGDWETGLGAASHMGRRDIAEFLLSHGARMDIFAAAMLGKLTIVRAFIEEYPDVRYTKGPHGISLRAHAATGGDAAKSVVDYLDSLDPV